MFSGVFKAKTLVHSGLAQSPRDALARLLQSRSLKPHRFIRGAEVGAFIVDHVCHEQTLIIELLRHYRDEDLERRQARCVYLKEMGYRVLSVTRKDLLSHPDRVLAQIRAALR